MLPLKLQLFSVVQSPSSGTVVCLCPLPPSSPFKNVLQEYPVTSWQKVYQSHGVRLELLTWYNCKKCHVLFRKEASLPKYISVVTAKIISDEIRDA